MESVIMLENSDFMVIFRKALSRNTSQVKKFIKTNFIITLRERIFTGNPANSLCSMHWLTALCISEKMPSLKSIISVISKFLANFCRSKYCGCIGTFTSKS